MARRDPVGIRLITRRGNAWTTRFPLVVEAVNSRQQNEPSSLRPAEVVDHPGWPVKAGSCDPCACAVRDQLRRCHPYGKTPRHPERNDIHREKDYQARIRTPFIFNEQTDEIRNYVTCCHQTQEQMIRSMLISLWSELHRMIATAAGRSYGNGGDLPE
jgi:hypothetical protein